jgi:hypothetical protein
VFQALLAYPQEVLHNRYIIYILYIIIYICIYLTAGGLTHLHTKVHIIQRKGMRAVPRLCELYPGICLTTEEKAWKNLS